MGTFGVKRASDDYFCPSTVSSDRCTVHSPICPHLTWSPQYATGAGFLSVIIEGAHKLMYKNQQNTQLTPRARLGSFVGCPLPKG